jgi:two-component system, cell cycle response regulator DivK
MVGLMVTRVLVVEDNPQNLKLIRDVLEYQGFDVLTATSGEDGVAAALTDSPDLVLMDLHLPGIDGHEALLRIRADPRCSGTPVVAVSAFAMKDDIERAVATGFDGYIAKPIDVHALPDQIAGFLSGGSDG